MAPETILGDAEVDRRADVYALGRGVLPAHRRARVRRRHVNEDADAPPQYTAGAALAAHRAANPRELDELVLACLQKDPNRRPQNAGELFRMAHNCRACEG